MFTASYQVCLNWFIQNLVVGFRLYHRVYTGLFTLDCTNTEENTGFLVANMVTYLYGLTVKRSLAIGSIK